MKNRKERERYWIDKIDCVNVRKLNFNVKEYDKEYCIKNKEKLKEYRKEYRKQYYMKNKK